MNEPAFGGSSARRDRSGKPGRHDARVARLVDVHGHAVRESVIRREAEALKGVRQIVEAGIRISRIGPRDGVGDRRRVGGGASGARAPAGAGAGPSAAGSGPPATVAVVPSGLATGTALQGRLASRQIGILDGPGVPHRRVRRTTMDGERDHGTARYDEPVYVTQCRSTIRFLILLFRTRHTSAHPRGARLLSPSSAWVASTELVAIHARSTTTDERWDIGLVDGERQGRRPGPSWRFQLDFAEPIRRLATVSPGLSHGRT